MPITNNEYEKIYRDQHYETTKEILNKIKKIETALDSNQVDLQVSLGDSQPMLLADIRHEIENIEYHSMAEGCGLEDANITDRYEAMAYGWDRAIEKVLECFPE